MGRHNRVSRRRGVVMGTKATGIFEAHYEEIAARTVKEPCLHNFFCECNRRSCIGRTYTASYYMRKLPES